MFRFFINKLIHIKGTQAQYWDGKLLQVSDDFLILELQTANKDLRFIAINSVISFEVKGDEQSKIRDNIYNYNQGGYIFPFNIFEQYDKIIEEAEKTTV